MRWRAPRPDRTASSRGDTALKAVADHLLRQFAADEDKPTFARLAVLPLPLMVALEHHVDALKHIAVIVVGEGENALRAQDLLSLGGDEVLQPRHELGRIERLVRSQRQRVHLLVMVMLQPAMAVAVAVIMVMAVVMIVIMVIVVVAGFEEFRLDLEDAIEVKRAAFQYVRQ